MAPLAAGSRLFGRLMVVLAVGLLLAQWLSAAINVAERDQLVNAWFWPASRRSALPMW